jgi:hypothetical protein
MGFEIEDVFKDWQTHWSERLRSPILGPFTALWLAWNWRLLAILLFSSKSIETRIQVIDNQYANIWDVLVIPLLAALGFALIFPWLSLAVESFQNWPNLRREKSKLNGDADLLRASVAKAEAQATLNKILAQDEITRRQQAEAESLKQELEVQRENADLRAAELEAQLEQTRLEYESQSDKSNIDAQKSKEELERLNKELEIEQARAKTELGKLRKELEKRERNLESRLGSTELTYSNLTDKELINLLITGTWRLFHNPKIGSERSKTINFGKSGEIEGGRNNNEYKWRVVSGKLELLQSDGNVHSRFHFLPESRIFIHTGDRDTRSARGQYIVPEFKINQ